MLAFLHCLATPILKHVIKAAGNRIGIPVGDWAVDIWERYCKRKNEAEMRAEIQQAVQDEKEWRRQVVVLLEDIAGSQPRHVKEQVANYLNIVPASIQRSLRRPDDPSGRTVPTHMRLQGPSDVQKFLPDRLPQFKIGDCPLPATDLVLDAFIGMGGFGEVWKAIHESRPNSPPVALKFCTDPIALKSLQTEVALLDRVIASKGQLKGVVELKYAHLQANPPCLEYEFVAGGDLALLISELHQQNRAIPSLIEQLMLQLANAVGSAHDTQPPIVHRDLKPTNVLVQRSSSNIFLKVADFGVGAVASHLATEESRNTFPRSARTNSSRAFTPIYASPEQRIGKPADSRDDVYALGVIWYQLLTGDLMSEAPRGSGWKRRLAEQGMSVNMIALLERCVEDRAEDRPKNACLIAKQLHLECALNDADEYAACDADRAIAAYTEIIRSYPEDARAYVGRADMTLCCDEDYQSAVADLSIAIRLEPENAGNYLLRALAFREGGDDVAALADYTKVIQLAPQSTSAYSHRADFYRDIEDYERALVDCDEIIRLDETLGYRKRAEIYINMGELDNAISDYSKCLRLDPERRCIYEARGAIYVRKGDLEKAIADYTRSIQLDSDSAHGYVMRGEVYEKCGDFDKAIADYTESIRLDPTPRGYWNRANAYGKIGEAAKECTDRKIAERLSSEL